jgi:hypothetical protein
MSIHLFSPVLYAGFVHSLQMLPQIPDSSVMSFFRQLHNINLSVWSGIILFLAIAGQFQESKFSSSTAFLCDSYNENTLMYISGQLFLWSKYVEWGDTLFLHLSGKPISMLQYTHHMSTAVLTYVGFDRTIISPHAMVFVGSNTLVHIPMYWYFAFPKGFLHKYRKLITQSQIVQHIGCLGVIIYTSTIDNCEQAEYVNIFGFAMYSMYLFYFGLFYIKTYNFWEKLSKKRSD